MLATTYFECHFYCLGNDEFMLLIPVLAINSAEKYFSWFSSKQAWCGKIFFGINFSGFFVSCPVWASVIRFPIIYFLC